MTSSRAHFFATQVRWAYCNVGTAVEIADGCDFSGRTFANAEAFDDGNSNNGECIFPFEHDGVVHNSCAPATPDNPHCKWIQLDGFFNALWWNVRFVENTTLTVNGRSTWFAPYSKPYFLYVWISIFPRLSKLLPMLLGLNHPELFSAQRMQCSRVMRSIISPPGAVHFVFMLKLCLLTHATMIMT